jgi:MYXO-CTERM domain-containing protein
MSSTRVTLLAIFLLALGVRLAYLQSDPRPLFGPWLEGGIAHNIVDDGHWFEVNTHAYDFDPTTLNLRSHLIQPADVDLKYADAHPHWQPEIGEPVGEALVLAGLWEITGSETFLPEQILRIVLDALTALLVYWIALQLFRRRRAAVLAAVFYAIYPPVAWQTVSPYLDFWAIDLTIAILAMQIKAARSTHRWRWLIACGLLVGAGTYFRPFVLVLSAILAVILNLPAGWRTALIRALATTAVALLLTIPWTIRNYDEFHTFVPFRSGLGQTMWEGLGDVHNDFRGTFTAQSTIAMVRRERPDLVVESFAWDGYLKHKAISVIEQHPPFYAELLAYRTLIATLWSYSPSWMHGVAVSPFAYARGPLALAFARPLDVLEATLEPAVFLLAMLGLGLSWRRRRNANIVLIATVLATIVPYIVLHMDHRYVIPASFAYLIWSALGVDLLAEAFASRLKMRRDRALEPSPAAVA